MNNTGLVPIQSDPSRSEWAMCIDGQHLCPECIAANRKHVDANKGATRYADEWAIVGYAGDEVNGLEVNEPESCANCYRKP